MLGAQGGQFFFQGQQFGFHPLLAIGELGLLGSHPVIELLR